MQKTSLAQSAAITAFSALLFIPAGVLAQPATALPVSFQVELGDLACKDSAGSASVLFVTDPKEGGYFEIIGDTIDQNKMTLDRRVALSSGTYTWKGVANQGYREVPPSIGEFVIPECTASSPAVSPISPVKKQPATTQSVKESVKSDKSAETISDNAKITTASSSNASSTEDTKADETGRTATFKWAVFGLVILGIIVGSFAWKKPVK